MPKKYLYQSFCPLSLTYNGRRNSQTNVIAKGVFQKGHFVFLIKPTYCVKQNTDLKKSNTERLKNKVIEIQTYPLIQEKS